MSLLPFCLLLCEYIILSGRMSPQQRSLRKLAFCVWPCVVSNAARSGMNSIKLKSDTITSREAVKVSEPTLSKSLLMQA